MTTLPHAFKRIRLNLARSREFPAGSARRGYEFVAPLDEGGHIDPELWRRYREHCRVLEPPELVAMMRASVERLAELYRTSGEHVE